MAFKEAVILLCLFFITHGSASEELHHQTRELRQIDIACILNNPSSAVAVVSATVQAFSGEVSAHIEASSSAVQEATDAIIEITAEAIANATSGGDAIAIADAAGMAVGRAVAEAYASSVGVLTSNGANNEACVEGFASATATATAFARGFIEVLAQATNVISFASASGAADAIAVATASAFAEVEVSACGSGIFDITVQADILATAIAEPFIEVFGVALAIVSGTTAFGEILVEASAGAVLVSVIEGSAEASVDGGGTGSTSGVAGTCTTQQDPCPIIRFIACCSARDVDCACGIDCSATLEDFGNSDIVAYRITENGVTSPPFPPPVGDVCFCP